MTSPPNNPDRPKELEIEQLTDGSIDGLIAFHLRKTTDALTDAERDQVLDLLESKDLLLVWDPQEQSARIMTPAELQFINSRS